MPLASSSAAPDAAPRGSTATGLAVTALIVGLIAAVLALVVAFLGLFSRYVWFLVVPLAVVALILGVLSMGRRGPARGSATGLAWIGVAAGMVALVLGVWGVTDYVRVLHANDQQLAAGGSAATSTQVGVPAPTPPPTPIQSQSGPQTQFGETYTMDGIAMQVAGPQSYTPSSVAGASDGTIKRAVKFTITITNNTNQTLIGSGVDVEGVADSTQVGRIYDMDIQSTVDDIAPGRTESFPVAFNVPTAPSKLTITVKPQATSSNDRVNYTGTV